MSASVDPTDVLVLVAVARGRTHTAAASALGINHTTVARRLRALERAAGERLLVSAAGGWELTAAGRRMLQVGEAIEAALATAPGRDNTAEQGLRGLVRVSSTEVFGITVVAPALTSVRTRHPAVSFELASVTRPTPTYGPAADLDIGVTRPPSQRLEVRRLGDYDLGLYASAAYLDTHGTPRTLTDLDGHTPIYYVESMLQVSDLDLIERLFPRRSSLVGATSVLAQLEMARRGAGVALLPVYLADGEPSLQRVLPEQARTRLTYWMSARPENLRRSEVLAAATSIEQHAARVLLDPGPATRRPRS
ncbi:LysR family transcriptional regulator [Klenkia sp. LSe6-5]|uniref:LysR family transcriptional regulator n=1 Tax=Klenkia sesuvii TaxID=3103137 RepID=A0ABU8DWX1_9ACTN